MEEVIYLPLGVTEYVRRLFHNMETATANYSDKNKLLSSEKVRNFIKWVKKQD
jgi:hypothetical protein